MEETPPTPKRRRRVDATGIEPAPAALQAPLAPLEHARPITASVPCSTDTHPVGTPHVTPGLGLSPQCEHLRLWAAGHPRAQRPRPKEQRAREWNGLCVSRSCYHDPPAALPTIRRFALHHPQAPPRLPILPVTHETESRIPPTVARKRPLDGGIIRHARVPSAMPTRKRHALPPVCQRRAGYGQSRCRHNRDLPGHDGCDFSDGHCRLRCGRGLRCLPWHARGALRLAAHTSTQRHRRKP